MTIYFITLALLLAPPETPKGHLVIVGGGSMAPPIREKALSMAGGKPAKILVMPQSSSAPDAGQGSAKAWRDMGSESVDILDLSDATKAVNQVKAADLIWIGGGDQNRFMKAIEGTGVAEAIRKKYRDGATIGGTSAGAAVQSAVMITGEADLNAIKAGATKTVDGLGLWPEAIVDQHFVRRQRMNRLISAVLDRPNLVGVGIDEGTAAVVTGSKFEVVGVGQVVVLDARKAAVSLKPGEPASATDIRMHVLRPGMTFDLATPLK